MVTTAPDVTGGPLDELLTAPGQPIELDAAGSSGVCLSGALQFRFSVDGGTELRGWSENPELIDAPGEDTDYLVETRCSTDLSCLGSVVVNVDVDCPTTGDLEGVFPETILAESKTRFSWPTARTFFLFSGDLSAVSSYAGDVSSRTSQGFNSETTPDPGAGFYFVVRTTGKFCNDAGLWTTGGAGESPLRESSLP